MRQPPHVRFPTRTSPMAAVASLITSASCSIGKLINSAKGRKEEPQRHEDTKGRERHRERMYALPVPLLFSLCVFVSSWFLPFAFSIRWTWTVLVSRPSGGVQRRTSQDSPFLRVAGSTAR